MPGTNLSSPRLAAACSALVLLVASVPALASPTFPADIRSHVGTPKTPACSLCHDGTPGIGTATSPFAASMKMRGLVANDVGSLNAALDALDCEKTDSDGDGVPDIDELRRGWDPNLPNKADGTVVPGATRPQVLVPTYGCSTALRAETHPVQGSVRSSASGALVVAFLILSLSFRRREDAMKVLRTVGEYRYARSEVARQQGTPRAIRIRRTGRRLSCDRIV